MSTCALDFAFLALALLPVCLTRHLLELCYLCISHVNLHSCVGDPRMDIFCGVGSWGAPSRTKVSVAFDISVPQNILSVNVCFLLVSPHELFLLEVPFVGQIFH